MNPNELGSKPFDSQLKTIKLYIYLNNKLILPVDVSEKKFSIHIIIIIISILTTSLDLPY